MSWTRGDLVSYPLIKEHKTFIWSKGGRAPSVVRFIKLLDSVPYHQYLKDDNKWVFCVTEHTTVHKVFICRGCGELQFNSISVCRGCSCVIEHHDIVLHAYNKSIVDYTNMMTRTFGGDFFVSPRRETRVNNCLSRTNTRLSGEELEE